MASALAISIPMPGCMSMDRTTPSPADIKVKKDNPLKCVEPHLSYILAVSASHRACHCSHYQQYNRHLD